jgi:hypothetical protein
MMGANAGIRQFLPALVKTRQQICLGHPCFPRLTHELSLAQGVLEKIPFGGNQTRNKRERGSNLFYDESQLSNE